MNSSESVLSFQRSLVPLESKCTRVQDQSTFDWYRTVMEDTTSLQILVINIKVGSNLFKTVGSD